MISDHSKIALSFSGGKDSLACAYLFRDLRDHITIYHLDTGDLLPEVMEIVEHVKSFWPRFVHLRTDVSAWIGQHGLPTDLLPHGAHTLGDMMGEGQTPLVQRYDCCFANLMWPVYQRIRDDGNTLLIRGTKRADMNKLPTYSGETKDGVELFLPLQEWSHDDVFAYLRSVDAPICRVYEEVTNSPECARCSGWWGEKRATYLRKYHPALFADYASRLRLVARELAKPMENLNRELAVIGAANE